MPKPRLLAHDEVTTWLSVHPEWSLREGRLHRSFDFTDFVTAFGFMGKVAVLAERLQHHPEWSNSYATVVIELTTHDVGGLSDRDLALGDAIDAL